jgi:hypothetical protein
MCVECSEKAAQRPLWATSSAMWPFALIHKTVPIPCPGRSKNTERRTVMRDCNERRRITKRTPGNVIVKAYLTIAHFVIFAILAYRRERKNSFPCPGRGAAQDEEIRRVPWRGVAPRDRPIAQGHPPGLIVIFHHIVIAFHRVDGPQLDMLAFKLDDALHFGTGIPPRHIAGPSSHRAHRGRGPSSGNTVDRVRRELESAAPRVKGVCGQHRSSPDPAKMGYGVAIRAHKHRRPLLQMRAV